jgi:hypothetical protein
MADLFSNDTEIDFERAASAFPDISLDGSDDFHTPPASQPSSLPKHDNLGFSFDDFDAPLKNRSVEVKVTGDDEIERFENEFPDIGVPQVILTRTSWDCSVDPRRLGANPSSSSSPATHIWRHSSVRPSPPAVHGDAYSLANN